MIPPEVIIAGVASIACSSAGVLIASLRFARWALERKDHVEVKYTKAQIVALRSQLEGQLMKWTTVYNGTNIGERERHAKQQMLSIQEEISDLDRQENNLLKASMNAPDAKPPFTYSRGHS